MRLSAEALLIMAIFALYMYDLTLLLYRNEVILSPKGGRDWKVSFGSSQFGIGGKELFIPNPLMMHQPCFKFSWSLETSIKETAPRLPRTAFQPVASMLWSVAFGLFVLVPIGLLTRMGDRALLVALVMVYGGILVAFILTWLNREKFRLSTRKFISLAFESFICPPFALNLVRHLSLNMDFTVDAVNAAYLLQSARRWNITRTKFHEILSSEIELEDSGVGRRSLLVARVESLPSE